jgi:hypothetical protein
MKNTWFKIAIGLFVGLFIGGCLGIILSIQNESTELYKYAKTLREQTINTLQYEFKEGAPSLNFIDRAKQLGARRIFMMPRTDSPGVDCNNSNDLDKLKAKYKSQSDGSATGVFGTFVFEIYFKHGKVTQTKVNNLVCGTYLGDKDHVH